MLQIGGGGRGVGKTAVGCGLVAAMPELRWGAVKVTGHVLGHAGEQGMGFFEELDSNSDKDTARYLRAGAMRAFLVPDGGADVLERARALAPECDGWLVEANRELAMRSGETVVKLAVVGGEDGKASLAGFVAIADALVIGGDFASDQPNPREYILGTSMAPEFRLEEKKWTPPELVAWVRARLMSIRG